MSGNKKAESRQQEVSELSRSLKLLAKELEVPVIAMSQLNRGAEQRTDKKPQICRPPRVGLPARRRPACCAPTPARRSPSASCSPPARATSRCGASTSRLRYVRRHLTHVFPTGRKQVFRLRLASGKQVTATANHPFLTYDGWRPLGELVTSATGSRCRATCRAPAAETAWPDAAGRHARAPAR